MGYVCRHFSLQELVGPEVFGARGDRCWEMLDSAMLRTLDDLRERYGPITINNWHYKGSFRESGMRDFATNTGAKYSMHKYGRAADCKFQGATTPIEVQADILKRQSDFPLLTCMENAAITKTWLHVDTRNHNQTQQIWVVDP